MFDSNCYLTNSCIYHYKANFNYNCYQLRLLNWLKDNYMTKEDILEYEKLSPLIVLKINEKNKEAIYIDIFYNILLKITYLIEEGSYKEAYLVYKESLINLKEQFINKQK